MMFLINVQGKKRWVLFFVREYFADLWGQVEGVGVRGRHRQTASVGTATGHVTPPTQPRSSTVNGERQNQFLFTQT